MLAYTSGPPMRYVAFLRGINLGKRRPPMSRLKALFEELGFNEVETFISSGNVIFTAPNRTSSSQLEKRIAACLAEELGYDVDTFVRTVEEVARIAKAKVFPEDGDSGITIHVAFLQEELAPAVARKLAGVRTDYDAFHVKGREFYWLCRGRMSDSKVWTLPEMKEIKLPTSTMRNITSVRKLVEKHIVDQ